MKVYYHPVSTTSRPIMLFAAENRFDLDFKVVDLFTGEHLQSAYAAINPNRLVAGARRCSLSPDRVLGDPQVSRREGGFARLPVGSLQAGAGQRTDGLVEHRFLSRSRLRVYLPADSPGSPPVGRQGSGHNHRMGTRQGQRLAEDPSTKT